MKGVRPLFNQVACCSDLYYDQDMDLASSQLEILEGELQKFRRDFNQLFEELL